MNEHKVVTLFPKSRKQLEINKELESVANRMAYEGWELVSVGMAPPSFKAINHEDVTSGRLKKEYILAFKRLKKVN